MAASSEDGQAADLPDAGPLPCATPEAVGMSSERLARIIPELRAEAEAGRLQRRRYRQIVNALVYQAIID